MHTTFCDEVFVDRLLKLGADPRAEDSFALVNFASRGRLRGVEFLLLKGANPNARSVCFCFFVFLLLSLVLNLPPHPA